MVGCKFNFFAEDMNFAETFRTFTQYEPVCFFDMWK